MNKRFSYTIPQMTRRLLRIAAPVKGLLIISTLASILGNLAQIGLMSSGALLLLASQKLIPANPALCAAAMAGCAVVIVAGPLYRRCNLPCRRLPAAGRYADPVIPHPPSPGSGLPH